MKSDLKAKFLQHLASKKRDGGFTLIELLVVIIIIGILAAIALPSFLNQANKAKQSEAKTYVGSANRAQQAYFLENSEFALTNEFGKLGLGVSTSTTNYIYRLVTPKSAVGTPATTRTFADVKVDNAPLKPYAGGVAVGKTGTGSSQEATTIAILCEAIDANTINSKGKTLADTDVKLGDTPECAVNAKPIK